MNTMLKMISKIVGGILFLGMIPLLSYAGSETLQISTLKPPVPVKTSNGQVFVYELNLVNTGNQPVRVGRIEVWDDQHHLLESYAETRLANNSFMYGKADPDFQKKHQGKYIKKGSQTFIELGKDMGAFVYLWVPVKHKVLPKQLIHKIWEVIPLADKNRFNVQVRDYGVAVSEKKPVLLGNPLRGTNWVAAGALSPDSYHRRAILPVSDKFYLAQRYAVDWMPLCPNGHEERGGLKDNAHWNAFGQEVLAAVDGAVAQVHEGVKENTPPGLPKPTPAIEDASGNYVILKFNQNQQDYYMLYAHMQPGSIRVKKGDKVKEGQVLGLLGNTGNSSQAHLHMQVMDSDDELKAEGVPFVFKHPVQLLGMAQGIDADYGVWKPLVAKPSVFQAMIPSENQVFQFSGEKMKQCD